MSFSFARALQSEALEIWTGKDENVARAQEVFVRGPKKFPGPERENCDE